jgi:hypothetical protein
VDPSIPPRKARDTPPGHRISHISLALGDTVVKKLEIGMIAKSLMTTALLTGREGAARMLGL